MLDTIWTWLAANWLLLLPWAILLLDKLVTISPWKWDDLVLTSIKSVLKIALGNRLKEIKPK